MNQDVVERDLFLKPGYIYLPAVPSKLCTVVASGIVVTMFDKRKKIGGMGHYIRPYREKGRSTALYAAPAITALSRMLLDAGSDKDDMEVHFFGGAMKKNAKNFTPDVSEENVKVGMKILSRLGLSITGKDVGGERARKIAFQSNTGEIMMAKVDEVRESDWYPNI